MKKTNLKSSLLVSRKPLKIGYITFVIGVYRGSSGGGIRYLPITINEQEISSELHLIPKNSRKNMEKKISTVMKMSSTHGFHPHYGLFLFLIGLQRILENFSKNTIQQMSLKLGMISSSFGLYVCSLWDMNILERLRLKQYISMDLYLMKMVEK